MALLAVAIAGQGVRVEFLTTRMSWAMAAAIAIAGPAVLAAVVMGFRPAAAWIRGRRAGRAWRQRQALGVIVLLFCFGVISGHAAAVGLAAAHRDRLKIPNAAGYLTFGGPHGKSLAVGRPWGRPCRPVRLAVEQSVPDWVYGQVAVVVDEARQAGLDVTLETRAFTWRTGSLYYRPGEGVPDVVRVPVFADKGRPPLLDGKRMERVRLGWDAVLDRDRRHEYVTSESAQLHLVALRDDPVAARRALRFLIALTQGDRVLHPARLHPPVRVQS